MRARKLPHDHIMGVPAPVIVALCHIRMRRGDCARMQLCNEATLGELRALAAHPRCVALGECGLDFNRNFSPQDVQLEWFEKQVLRPLECCQRPVTWHDGAGPARGPGAS